MTAKDPSVPSALANRSAPEELKTALHAHLKSVVDKPLTTKMLLELQQASGLCMKLLIVSGEPRAFPQRQNGGLLAGAYFEGNDVVDPGEPLPIQPLAPAPFGAAENFGTEALRDLIASTKKPRVDDLMRALEDAERALKKKPDDPFYLNLSKRLRNQIEEAVGGFAEDIEQPAAEPAAQPEA